MIHPQPKPIKRKTVKRKKLRAESEIKKAIRAECVERDGYCRYAKDNEQGIYGCQGRSEWAHLGDKKRAHTRGMPPELRHTTFKTMMLCTRHHRAYDDGKMAIRLVTVKGANGFVRYEVFA